jgi:hypothetical protein
MKSSGFGLVRTLTTINYSIRYKALSPQTRCVNSTHVWHGARFDIRDGKVKRGPALSAVPFYATRIEGDAVQVSAKPIKVAK